MTVTMTVSDFRNAKRIVLRRCKNGWLAQRENESPGMDSADLFVFPSTAALCRNLPWLIGESGWELTPARDEKGHFAAQTRKVKPRSKKAAL